MIFNVHDKINEITSVRNLKTYTSLSQLGLSKDVTPTDLWYSIPDSSILIVPKENLTNKLWYFPFIMGGVLVITKYSDSRGTIELYSKSTLQGGYTTGTYRMGFGHPIGGGDGNAPNGYWERYNIYRKIAGTLAAGETSITLSDPSILVENSYDFYTSIYGVSPTNVTVTDGSITLEFDVQETDMSVEVRVM